MTSANVHADIGQTEAQKTIESAWRSALACHRAGHLHEAETLYVAILDILPRHPDANYNLGLLRAQTERYDASLDNFLTAIEAEPTTGEYWLSYIEVLSLCGKREQAREVLVQARMHGLQGLRVDELSAQLGARSEP